MTGIEWICLGIVALYVAWRLHSEPQRADSEPSEASGAAPLRASAGRAVVLARLGALALAGWLGEVSCVRAYGLYGYEGGPWTLWLDVVPLVVVLTWPVVIHSAWELARALSPKRAAALGTLLVLSDAALIEPVSVAVGLWSWTAPGPFAVPPVGVLGWALFAAVAITALERWEGRRAWAAVVLGAPLLLHPLVLLAWWGALRWLPRPPDAAALALVCGLSALVTALAWRSARRSLIPWVMARGPGAFFFFGLLAWGARDNHLLVAWALAFAAPYVALLAASRLRAS